jgi:lysophospholipase L1-like esterase
MPLLAGCIANLHGPAMARVAILGDSNTCLGVQPCARPSWVEPLTAKLAAEPVAVWPPAPISVRSYAIGGSSACTVLPSPWDGLDASAQLDAALADGADVIIAAFVTNDLRYGLSIGEAIDCLLALRQRAADAGAIMLVALAPPTAPPEPYPDAGIEAANAALRAAIPATDIVDFSTGFGPEQLEPDGVHVNEAGQALRAARAYERLARWPAP